MDARLMQRYGLRPAAPGERAVEAQAAPAEDTRLAEQQVAQLQKAQAVAESVVAPLRANFPTRGLRYSFVQVLQTEPDQPLTIRLQARNDRVAGWFGRLVRAAAAFLALWLATALVLCYRRPRPARRFQLPSSLGARPATSAAAPERGRGRAFPVAQSSAQPATLQIDSGGGNSTFRCSEFYSVQRVRRPGSSARIAA